jgi:hypothetical protein
MGNGTAQRTAGGTHWRSKWHAGTPLGGKRCGWLRRDSLEWIHSPLTNHGTEHRAECCAISQAFSASKSAYVTCAAAS